MRMFKKKTFRSRRFWFCISCLVLVVGLAASSVAGPRHVDDAVDIVLSPHFDDAVLSLGGKLAKEQRETVVATFFTAKPPSTVKLTSWDTASGFTGGIQAVQSRMEENAAAIAKLGARVVNFDYLDNQYGRTDAEAVALESEMAQDIQALVASYGDRTVNVYGPATFGKDIGHPDHELLHKAYLDVVQMYPKQNAQFFVYEDYPYIEKFNDKSVMSLEGYLEKADNEMYDEVRIPLTAGDLRTKLAALKKYPSQIKAFSAQNIDIVKDAETFNRSRCGADPSLFGCEVFYRILRI